MRRFLGDKMFFLLAFGLLSALYCVSVANAALLPLVVLTAAQTDPAQIDVQQQKQKPAAKEEAEAKDKVEESKEDSSQAENEKAKEDRPSKKSDDKSSDEDDEEEDEDDADKKPVEKSEKPKKKEKKKPKPHKVKRDKLKIEVELDGIFVADEMEEVALRPEAWTQFKILEAVDHGTLVKKGEVLIRFDDEKLEKELAKESLDQNIGQLSLMQDEEELPRLKRMLELSFEEAERKNERTQADYEYYYSTDRPFTVQIAHFRYKSAQEQLAAAREELNQLQKMYDADELTEETEEIVLKRQRFAVETAELILELNKESRDYTLNVSLPRSDEYYETSKDEAELAFRQAKTAVEVGLTRKSYDMEKKRYTRAKSVERHGKLLSDKGLMVIRAPTDGVVYYGKCTNGKWSQVASLKAKLKPFGSAARNTVLMTIVKPGSLHIESSLSEKKLPDFKTGLKACVVPAADKELELEGKVEQVASIPGASNKFAVKLDIDNAEVPGWLVAGMTCKAKVVTYENKKALVIPLDLVQTDEDDEKVKYVMLLPSEEDEADEDEPVRRKVKLGRRQGKVVEVLKGLEEGDKIVKEEKKDDDED